MANLSNINNNFIVTDGGNVLIGGTSATSKLDVTSNSAANGVTLRLRSSQDYAFFNWRDTGGTELLAEQFIQRTAAKTAIMKYTIANNSSSPATYLTIAANGNATFAGNVSVNSASQPAKNLVVEGETSAYATIRVLSNSTGHGAEVEFGDSSDVDYGSITQFASAAGEGGRMRFRAGGIETMNLRGGNVGIGTNSPDALLDLESTTPALRITDKDNDKPYELRVDAETFSIKEVSNSRTLMSMTTGAVITLDSLGSNTVINTTGAMIVPNGKVGIGTSLPQDKLEIKSGYIRMFDPSSNINAGFPIRWSSNNGGTNVTFANISGVTTSAGNRTGDLYFSTSNAGAPTEKMRIKSDANVTFAIGPDTNRDANSIKHASNSFLYMRGGAAGIVIADDGEDTRMIMSDNGNIRFDAGTKDNAMTIIGSSGDVAIGTTNPSGKLEVNGDNYNVDSMTTFTLRDLGNNYDDGDNAVDIVMRSRYWSGDANTSQNSRIRHLKDNSNGSTGTMLQLGTTTEGAGDATTKMTIKANGNVGIGTDDPGSKLHVKGDFVSIEDPSGGFKMELSADTDPVTIMSDNLTGAAYGQIAFVAGNGSGANDQERMRINSSGNLGIGVSPTQKLDVAGQATHEGLVLKSGTGLYIDTLTEFNITLDFVGGNWISTGLTSVSNNGLTLGEAGTYIMQIYSDDHSPGEPFWYSMYWSGIMSWWNSTTNQSTAIPIPLQRAGHGDNNRTLDARILWQTASGTPANNGLLQLNCSDTAPGTNLRLRFRRLL